jgi:hypothetical protein
MVAKPLRLLGESLDASFVPAEKVLIYQSAAAALLLCRRADFD